MQRAAHAFADHVEKARRLSGDQHVAFAKDVAVDQRRAEILGAAFVVGVRIEFHAVFLGKVIDDVGVLLREVVAALEADADDLAAVARVAPGVMAESGVEPEMEILGGERTFDDVVELLADEKPRNLLRIIRIDGARDQRTRAIGADHPARAVIDRLAVPARVHQHVVAVVFECGERGFVVHLGAALLDRPVVGILAVQVRRGAAEKIHRHRHHRRKMKGHAAARGRLVQRLARQRPEVLDQKAVAARRQDAAADLVARQRFPLEHDGLEPGVGQPLGRRRRRQAGADDDDVNRTHGSVCQC